ncbi:MAG TPA: lamin tail domain-containing protein, partial [Flavobacterium sp.]|nr:lamin tail domain-containing protein [Flavobacterium sp.]
MKKQYLLIILICISGLRTHAQLEISSGGTNYLINFDGNMAGVNTGAFQGTGFSPSPVAGQLNSNAWATTGMSEGNSVFGGTYTSGVFAKGISEGEIVDGGFYAFDVDEKVNTSNYALGFQPTQNDFTPGTITLKIKNTTGQYIEAINLAFKIWNFNDFDYSTKLSFAYSYDNITFVDVSVLNYSSPAVFVADPFKGGAKWESSLIGTVINDLAVPNNGFIYLRWTTDDLNPLTTESRDEIALDDINVAVSTVANPAPLIENVVYTPYPTTSDAITVTADVSDVNGTVSSVILKYGTSTGLYTATPLMTNSSGNQYTYTIPANTFINNSPVFFAIEASDNASATRISNEYSLNIRNAVTTTLPYSQSFDTNLSDCYPISVKGSKKSWYWSSEKNDQFAEGSGYNTGEEEEDWLILPGVVLSTAQAEFIDFETYYNFGIDGVGTFDLVFSTDYPGTGSPEGFTWTPLNFQKPTKKQQWYYSELIELSPFVSGTVYLAFRYTNPNYEYRTWRVDKINITSSTVINPEPTNYPTAFTATAPNGSTIITTWVDAVGTNLPFGYHLQVNTTGVFTAPVDAVPVDPDVDLTDGEGSINIFHGGFENVPWTGLLPNTTYYFRIYSYSNSGDLINFKTDGSPPTVSATTTAGSSAQPGDVIITEFMAAPGSASDSYGEWFEIFNTTNAPINLDGWVIESTDGLSNVQHTIVSDPPLVIPAKGFLVLGLNADVLTNGGVPVNYVYDKIFLSNTDDYLRIRTDTQTEMDFIDWSETAVWGIRTGQTLIFIAESLTADNNDGHNWIPSLIREKGYSNSTQTDLGSPGTNGLFQNLIQSTTWTGTGNWSEGNKPGQTNWSNGSP